MNHDEIWQQYQQAYGVDSVEAFQHFFGLQTTGLLDDDTTKALTLPRCGIRDNLVVISEAKWRKRDLRLFVKGYLDGLSHQDQDSIYMEALNDWAHVCDKKFSQVGSIAQADIIVDVGRGRQDGFDGPGGTLAWMTLGTNNDNPILGKFDPGENWSKDPNRDIYLKAVACHEFGHALNLDHAPQNSGALMAPFYSRRVPKPTDHDIRRIQSLYGPPVGGPQPPSPPTPPPVGPVIPGDEGWLRRLYQDLVGRQPSAAEIGAWMPLAKDRPGVCKALLASNEHLILVVTSWYEGFLKRKPDAGGLTNFVSALISGMTYPTAQTVVLSSPEYYTRGTKASVDLDPAKPFVPDPDSPTNGGFMDDLKEIIITFALTFVKSLGFFGRFIPESLIRKIVDKFFASFGLAGAKLAQPVTLASVDQDSVIREMRAILEQE